MAETLNLRDWVSKSTAANPWLLATLLFVSVVLGYTLALTLAAVEIIRSLPNSMARLVMRRTVV